MHQHFRVTFETIINKFILMHILTPIYKQGTRSHQARKQLNLLASLLDHLGGLCHQLKNLRTPKYPLKATYLIG